MAGRIDFSQFVEPGAVLELQSNSKAEALSELCDVLVQHPHITDGDEVRRALFDREQLVSTGIGIGVAVPHVKIAEVTDYTVVVGRHREGLEFDALDGAPVHLIFVLAASEQQAGDFVGLLASVVRFVKEESVRTRLLGAAMPEEFLEVMGVRKR